ncbi:integrase arm-type DNA-binding domain-containing protein [Bosea sp. BIWAKO-01]|uniref:tyrosine-type recombinase/integrase n=1 Tax=Bosea sp. BIWAKO-01 TaxID=506668 RepID=UPI000853A768|nr:integrase arm-type DNA-binding domain-containing protein [Bosea sp. BIWAKO-01]GAU83483.1 integrase [Bosea sp. BIWAKO-01]
MPLTDTAIKNAKALSKVRKLSDGGGLQLWLMPTGAKLWRLAYRFDGKQRKLSIGAYPGIDLKAARAAREEAKEHLRAGRDPSEQKRLDRITKQETRATTFTSLAAELKAKKQREGKAEGTIEKFEWLLSMAEKDLGKRPVAEISAAEVLSVLRKSEKRGHLETAKRLRSVIGQVFRYAIAAGKVANDPTLALRGALAMPKPTSRAAITDPKRLGALLRAIDGYEGQNQTRAALQLMALLFQRPGELRSAEWSEFNLDEAVWLIPAARMKMRREHAVPLPRQALLTLEELREISDRSPLLFPSLRSASRPMSDVTMNAALRRLGYAKDEMTPHGFRATASTLLNECGKWSSDAIEKALAHQERNAVRRAYARGEHWQERVRMAQWWADYLDTLRNGATIIPMPAKDTG